MAEVAGQSQPTTAPAASKAPDVKVPKEAAGVFVLSGHAGRPFNIDGKGFGDEAGSVTIGDRTISVSRWIDRSIKGTLPADLKPGSVVVRTANGVSMSGTFAG